MRGRLSWGHSPSAYFCVNIEQGASDQVAGGRAEDGRRVEDGWGEAERLRPAASAIPGSREPPALRSHGSPPERSPSSVGLPLRHGPFRAEFSSVQPPWCLKSGCF